MSKQIISRRAFLIVGGAGALAVAGGVGGQSGALADDAPLDKDYLAVFSRMNQPIAVIEKPKGAPIGRGTSFEIESFPLRVERIDAGQAKAYLQRLAELDSSMSRVLPEGFRVYTDGQNVEPSFASASHRFKITVTDPVDGMHLKSSNDCGGGGM
jgi:hypothetical protein